MTDEFEQQWLSDLPSDWAEKRADHLCIPYRVSVDPLVFGDCLVAHYSIPQVQETGGPCIEPASDIDSIKLVIDASTLLVSKLNPRKKTICIAERHPEYPTLASGEFVAIHSEEMDRRYAYYLWCSEKVTDRLSAHRSICDAFSPASESGRYPKAAMEMAPTRHPAADCAVFG